MDRQICYSGGRSTGDRIIIDRTTDAVKARLRGRMLDVCLLGTGGMMPLPYRWLTSLMMRYNGKSILIDCGEGTQIAMREKGWSPNPIDIICFTHFHADHIKIGRAHV